MSGVYAVRRAEQADVRAITNVISRSGGPSLYRKLFGSYKLSDVVEQSMLSVVSTLKESDSVVASFVAVDCAPPAALSSLGVFDYDQIRGLHPELKHCSGVNTVWLACWCVATSLRNEDKIAVPEDILRSVFSTLGETQTILFLCHKDAEPGTTGLPQFFHEIDHAPLPGQPNDCKLWVCHKSFLYPPLDIRPACVEDYDDLLPVFERNAQSVADHFGEFYLADLIRSQDEHSKCLVGLDNGRAVGVMFATSNVDRGTLQRSFELQPFQDLECKPKVAPPREIRHAARVVVIGANGAGKTTMAKSLAHEEGLTYVSPEWCLDEAQRLHVTGGALPADTDTNGGSSSNKEDEGEEAGKGSPQQPEEKEDKEGEETKHEGGAGDDADQDGKEGGKEEDTTENSPSAAAAAGAAEQKEENENEGKAEDDPEFLAWKVRLAEAMERRAKLVDAEEPLDDALIMSMTILVLEYLCRAFPSRGWVLDSFPTKEALWHQLNRAPDCAPDVVLYLELGEDLRQERHENARIDPDTGAFYSMLEPPEDAAVIERLEEAPLPAYTSMEDSAAAHAFMRSLRSSANAFFTIDGSNLAEEIVLSAHAKLDGFSRSQEANTIRLRKDVALFGDEERGLNACFSIALFCIDEEHEHRTRDFLPHMFDLFPDLTYAVLTVPTASNTSPLLRFFNLAPLRVGAVHPQVLYVLHRNAIMAEPTARVVRVSVHDPDAAPDSVGEFLSQHEAFDARRTRDLVEATLDDEVASLPLHEGPPECSFAMLIDGAIAGLVVVSRKPITAKDVTWLRTNYNIDDIFDMSLYKAKNIASIMACHVNVVYERYTRFFLTEVFRMFDKALAIFELSPNAPVPPAVLDVAVALDAYPRQQPGPGRSMPLANRPSKHGVPTGSPLFVLARRTISEPKIAVNARIVVVGASDAGLAFVAKLLSVPYLRFSSITLVSAHELPPTFDANQSAPPPSFSIVTYDKPATHEMSALALSSRVSFVLGKVVEIDREAQTLLLADHMAIPYNSAVIATGRQDVALRKIGGLDVLDRDECNYLGAFSIADPNAPAAVTAFMQDHGIFDAMQTEIVQQGSYAKESAKDDETVGVKIVVYGDATDTLSTVQCLLDMEVDPSRICLVRPRQRAVSQTGDTMVDRILEEQLDETGIDILDGWILERISVSDTNGLLSNCIVKQDLSEDGTVGALGTGSGSALGGLGQQFSGGASAGGTAAELSVACRVLITASRARVDQDMFKAVTNSGLVFDGGLVVNANMNTNDPCIYGTGSFARFSRTLGRTASLGLCNAMEVGEYTAECVLDVTDPMRTPLDVSQLPAPRFILPKTLAFSGPCLHVCRSALPDMGGDTRKLVAGSEEEMHMSYVKLNNVGVVVEIVYCGPEPVEPRNLGRLLGYHEAYLNKVSQSFNSGQAEDWIAFFRANWAHALCHHAFRHMVHDLRELLGHDEDVRMVVTKAITSVEETQDYAALVGVQNQMVGAEGEKLNSGTRQKIEDALQQFLQRHAASLPEFNPSLESPAK